MVEDSFFLNEHTSTDSLLPSYANSVSPAVNGSQYTPLRRRRWPDAFLYDYERLPEIYSPGLLEPEISSWLIPFRKWLKGEATTSQAEHGYIITSRIARYVTRDHSKRWYEFSISPFGFPLSFLLVTCAMAQIAAALSYEINWKDDQGLRTFGIVWGMFSIVMVPYHVIHQLTGPERFLGSCLGVDLNLFPIAATGTIAANFGTGAYKLETNGRLFIIIILSFFQLYTINKVSGFCARSPVSLTRFEFWSRWYKRENSAAIYSWERTLEILAGAPNGEVPRTPANDNPDGATDSRSEAACNQTETQVDENSDVSKIANS